jgi:hypothetical protein
VERRPDSLPGHAGGNAKLDAVQLLIEQAETRWKRGLDSRERDDVRAALALAEAATILLGDAKLELHLAGA